MALVYPSSSTSSKEVNMSTERKKRTRPITACQSCHRMKIKCVLKPNEPICQRCSSTGNECLFRVDDLAPTLRLERFPEYTPVASRDGCGGGVTKGKKTTGPSRARISSTLASAKGDNSNFDGSLCISQEKVSNKKTANGKAKAVFRSFANPAKLVAPSRTTLSEIEHKPVMNLQRTSYPSNGHDRFGQASLSSLSSSSSSSSSSNVALPSFHSSFKHVDSEFPHTFSTHLGQAHTLQGQRYHYKPPPYSSSTSIPNIPPFSSQPLASSSTLAPALKRQADNGEEHIRLDDEKGRKKAKTDVATSEVSPISSNGRQPTFKKIALPFFRWFGATANTPGIRRIKIGVYHETEVDERNVQTERPLNFVDTHSGGESLELQKLSPHRTESDAVTMVSQEAIPQEVNLSESSLHCRCPSGSIVSTSSQSLFESERPRYPRREILIKMSKIVIKHYKASCFPWLEEEELMAGAESGELPAILANSICAVSAQISNHPDLGKRSGKKGGEPFADMAKVLLVPMLSWPSLDVIEALVIISYAEFAAGADSGLWMYIGMALRMATDLGLQYELTIKSMSTIKQQNRARLLFWAIVSLDRITCFGTGRSVSIREDSFDCQLPALGEDPSTNNFVFGHIVQTLLKRGRIGELLNQKGDEFSLEERGAKLKSIWHDLTHYYETLPPTLQFGVTTFRKMASTNQGAAFVYLHVLLQSTMSLLNRPSLFRRFDKDFNVSVPSRLASIASHASGTIVSILRFAEDASMNQSETLREDEDPNMNPYIDCNPYLDQLILPAGRAFLAEREGVRDALRRLGYAAQSRPVSRGGGNGGGRKVHFGNLASNEESESTGDATAAAALESMPTNQAVDGPFNGLIGKRQYAQMNLSTCQRMLNRLAQWWTGAEWPARALRQETGGTTEDEDDLDSTDEDAQPAPDRDVEMVLKWAKNRTKKTRNNGDNVAASRFPDHDENMVNVDVHGATSVNMNREQLTSLVPNHYLSSESTASGDSPLGLGFSGSFGTTTEIDIEALINAWTAEERFMDSTTQQGRQATTMNRLQDWDMARSDEQMIHYHDSDSVSASALGQSMGHHSHSSPQPTISSGATATAANLLHGHLQNPSPGILDLDYSTMQLEEFFKAGLEPPGRPMRFQGSTSQNMVNIGAEYCSDDLPSALLNTFAFQYGPPFA